MKPTPPGRVMAPVVKSGPVSVIWWIGLNRRDFLPCGPLASNGIASENTAPRFTSRAAFTIAAGVM